MAPVTAPERRLEVINGLYRLEVPDRISVQVHNNPELDTEQRIRPDGNISLKLVGDLYVEGKTPAETAKLIEQELSRYVKDVSATVTVTGFFSKNIYVYREDGSSLVLSYTGDMTAAQAITMAGGLTVRAAPSRILVVRRDPVAPKVYRLNLNKVVKRGESQHDIQLVANDIVIVPSNVFGKIGNAVQTVLFPLQSIVGANVTLATLANLGPAREAAIR